ncbi:hypothetical protein [Ilumatobacter sp.]|uniref:hypothetical protein n=1 Tax=Ilumatobacter sp. TaxID=1967498 RepID=UPI003C4CC0A0
MSPQRTTPSRTRSRRFGTAAVAVLAVAAASCGSDSDDTEPAASDAPATTAEPAEAEAPATDPPSTDAPATDVPIADDSPYIVEDAGDAADADPGDGVCATDEGSCTLRAAVDEANAIDGEQTISLSSDVTLATAGADEDANATGDFDITDDLVIEGGGWVIDADRLDRVFHVQGVSLDLSNITMINGLVEGEGASGGAVFNDAGALSIADSALTNSSATRAGGAIEANEGMTSLMAVELSGNSTGDGPGNGGGLHLTGAGTVTVADSTVAGNTATAEGGGLWNSAGGTFEITNTMIEGNTANGAAPDSGGGGLYNDGGTMTVNGGTIDANIADGEAGSGGGILNNLGDLTVTDTVITNNTSVRAGGGIEANEGTTTLMSVEMSANSTGESPGNGGGLHLTGVGTVTVTDSTVTGNIATAEGGGLWNSAGGTMSVTGTDASGNDAPDGPDLFNDGGTFTVDGENV